MSAADTRDDAEMFYSYPPVLLFISYFYRCTSLKFNNNKGIDGARFRESVHGENNMIGRHINLLVPIRFDIESGWHKRIYASTDRTIFSVRRFRKACDFGNVPPISRGDIPNGRKNCREKCSRDSIRVDSRVRGRARVGRVVAGRGGRVIPHRETSSSVSHGEWPAVWLFAVRSAGKRRPYGSTGPFFRHILGRPLPRGTPLPLRRPRDVLLVAERRVDNSN